MQSGVFSLRQVGAASIFNFKTLHARAVHAQPELSSVHQKWKIMIAFVPFSHLDSNNGYTYIQIKFFWKLWKSAPSQNFPHLQKYSNYRRKSFTASQIETDLFLNTKIFDSLADYRSGRVYNHQNSFHVVYNKNNQIYLLVNFCVWKGLQKTRTSASQNYCAFQRKFMMV